MSRGTDQRHKRQRNPPYPALGAVSSQGRTGGCASVPLPRDAPGGPFLTRPAKPLRYHPRGCAGGGSAGLDRAPMSARRHSRPSPAAPAGARRQPPAATCRVGTARSGGTALGRSAAPSPRNGRAPRSGSPCAPQPGSFRENYSRGLVLWHKGVFSACWRERTLCPLPACF